VQDIVGLYLDPPDDALVLSVDERARYKRLTSANLSGWTRVTFDPGQEATPLGML